MTLPLVVEDVDDNDDDDDDATSNMFRPVVLNLW
jgi:hypothetical protein